MKSLSDFSSGAIGLAPPPKPAKLPDVGAKCGCPHPGTSDGSPSALPSDNLYILKMFSTLVESAEEERGIV